MRYIMASIVPLFLLLLIAAALPASASDDFEGWALKRGKEIDSRWTRAAAREAGTADKIGTRRTMTVSRRSTVMKAGRPAKRNGRPSGRASGNSTGIDGSSFTRRGSQNFLWRSTRNRKGPTRGTSKLTSPAQSVRASTSKRRLPTNNSSKYRRSTGSGRAGAWRKRPTRMGSRISTSRTRRRSTSSSMTRGATRVRKSATRGL